MISSPKNYIVLCHVLSYYSTVCMKNIFAQGLTGTGRTNSLFPARSAMWRYRGTPFSAAPALHMASDTPRIELAPNLAGRNTTHGCSQWCGNMSLHIYAITVHVMWMRLTFVVSAIHFNHHVVQFVLLQHTDSLTEKKQNVTHTINSVWPFLLKMEQILLCYSQTEWGQVQGCH